MVAQTHLFLEKMTVSSQKTIFLWRKPKKQKKKKQSFPKLRGWGLQKMVFFWVFFVFFVFSRKRWFFGSKPSFSREKDGFWRSSPGKTIFFSRKRWFFEGWLLKTIFFSRKRRFRAKKPSFCRENQKSKKKTSFPKLWGWGLQKMVFLVFFVFSRKRWFFEGWLLKTIFFSRKRRFRAKKPSFCRENPKKHQKNKKTKKKPSFPKLWGWSPLVGND